MNYRFIGKTCGLTAGSALMALIAGGVAAIGLSAPGLSEAGNARGHLYSTAAVNRFCKGAQRIIATTELEATNVIWDDLGVAGIPFPPPGTPSTGFIGSDALPYDGAEDLPLTTQQFVGYGLDDKGKDYPQTVMCKMKSWDALDFYYPGAASAGADCATVNANTGAAVIESLTNDNQEPQVITEIVYDNWVTFTGQQWTDSSPAPSAYISNADGKLHVVGKQLYVERTNPSPFVPANKKGVDYCQVIAPEYLREVIVGNIQAPTCDAPPVYNPPIFGPPEAPKPWACANP